MSDNKSILFLSAFLILTFLTRGKTSEFTFWDFEMSINSEESTEQSRFDDEENNSLYFVCGCFKEI